MPDRLVQESYSESGLELYQVPNQKKLSCAQSLNFKSIRKRSGEIFDIISKKFFFIISEPINQKQ